MTDTTTGGFLIIKAPMVRSMMFKHTSALADPVSALDIEVLNTIQDTPWTVNRFVLDVLCKAFRESISLKGVPMEKPLPPPSWPSYEAWRTHLMTGSRKTVPGDVWEAMTEDQRKSHRKEMAEIYEHNACVEGKRRAFVDAITVAQELSDDREIYFPHNRCFRGRFHPLITSGPHPQGNDVAKSVIMFARGVELGEDGLDWLLIRLAGCFGHDKLSLVSRIEWAVENKEKIIASAEYPFENLWWQDADEPWGALATCHELNMAWQLSDPSKFSSHLPVPLDGTCNGLQHLSAMALDPKGALATNLTGCSDRQDIYLAVAEAVRERLKIDASEGNEISTAWLVKFEDTARARKVVKRAVMTTPYGVTARGIREQLVDDGHTKDLGAPRGAAADYLTDCIHDALMDSSGPAKEIMAWLRVVATNLAKAEIPFDWTTPTGSKVRQAYYALDNKRIVTLCGKLSLDSENSHSGLNSRKQAAGAAPNFIHSFDAAHVALTVHAATQVGIYDFALIHDSYGTHAANTKKLSKIIRETFRSIYLVDRLQELKAEIESYAPHVDIPEPPPRGDFNIDSVLESEFFFS